MDYQLDNPDGITAFGDDPDKALPYPNFKTDLLESELSDKSFFKVCGESRIRTCEVLTADLQSALVGRLSISPNHISIKKRAGGGTRTHDLLITNQLL